MGRKICLWCKEELQAIPGKGFVHQDGELYKTRMAYPRVCRKCGTRLTDDGYCYPCDWQYKKDRVDDHCATPV